MSRHIGLVLFLWSILLFTLIYISVSRYTTLKKGQTEGFEENVTAKPCKRGYYCPPGTTSARYQCPPGTYGNSENLRTSACSGVCRAGCVCAAGSTNPCPKKCPAGFYCVLGTTNDGTVPPIVCPAGNYCPEGSSQPTRCPEGKYCPEGTERI